MDKYIGTKLILAAPQVGADAAPGYDVVYEHGYESWSPKYVFEAAYRPTTAMTFGDAIYMLKRGHRVARAGWNGKGMWLALQQPDEFSLMSLPYIYMYNADAHLVPWLASQTDMLAEDWTVLNGGV